MTDQTITRLHAAVMAWTLYLGPVYILSSALLHTMEGELSPAIHLAALVYSMCVAAGALLVLMGLRSQSDPEIRQQVGEQVAASLLISGAAAVTAIVLLGGAA